MEHITKREIFDRLRDIREMIENSTDPEIIREKVIDLETGVLQDCRDNA